MLYVLYVRNMNKIHRTIFENESWGAGVLGTGVKDATANFSFGCTFFILTPWEHGGQGC